MFQRALICTELSDGLQRLVQFVPSLAAAGLQQIVFLHVASFWEEGEIPRVDEQKVQQARDRLAAALQSVPEGTNVMVEVVSGRPVETILKVAQTHQSDVILLGTPNRTLLNEKLFGSTTISLSQRINIPILTLRPQLISTYTSEELSLRCQHLFRCLLIPYDGTQPSHYLIQQIKQHLQANPAHALGRCVLCWVVDNGGRRELMQEASLKQAQERLATVKAELEALKLRVDVHVELGDPLTQILAVAAREDISAIAVSSDSIGKLLEWSIPSFTGEVLRRSWHPVLFFPFRPT